MIFNIFSKKKKEKKPFGENIEPDCMYCLYNNGEDIIMCENYVDDVCKKYVYDPLRRQPKKNPPMREYKKDDFSL